MYIPPNKCPYQFLSWLLETNWPYIATGQGWQHSPFISTHAGQTLSWVCRPGDEWEQTVQAIQVAWDKRVLHISGLVVDTEKNLTQSSSRKKKKKEGRSFWVMYLGSPGSSGESSVLKASLIQGLTQCHQAHAPVSSPSGCGHLESWRLHRLEPLLSPPQLQ